MVSTATDRGNKTPSHATDEERDHLQTPASRGGKAVGGARESVARLNGMEKGKRGPPTETPVAAKRAKMTRPSKVKEVVHKQPPLDMEEEEDRNCTSDSKSETSDFEAPSSGTCTTVSLLVKKEL